MLVAVFETKHPAWHACLGSWTIGVLLDTALLVISRSSGYNPHTWKPIALHITRIALQCTLITVGLFAIFFTTRNGSSGEETEPLMTSAAEGSASTSDLESQYGSLRSSTKQDDGSEYGSDEEDYDIKELQKMRMEEEGGMWNYLKSFLIFLPYIWPSNDRWMQLWLLAMLFSIGIERVLTLLIPRQLGIITDALVNGAGKGKAAGVQKCMS